MAQPTRTNPSDFEEWHLTALALGELDLDLKTATEQRIADDPEIAKQYREIVETLQTVSQELRQGSVDRSLDDHRTREVLHEIHSTPRSSVRPALKEERRWGHRRIAGMLAALAIAASLFVVFQIKPPSGSTNKDSISFKNATPSLAEKRSAAAPDDRLVSPSQVAPPGAPMPQGDATEVLAKRSATEAPLTASVTDAPAPSTLNGSTDVRERLSESLARGASESINAGIAEERSRPENRDVLSIQPRSLESRVAGGSPGPVTNQGRGSGPGGVPGLPGLPGGSGGAGGMEGMGGLGGMLGDTAAPSAASARSFGTGAPSLAPGSGGPANQLGFGGGGGGRGVEGQEYGMTESKERGRSGRAIDGVVEYDSSGDVTLALKDGEQASVATGPASNAPATALGLSVNDGLDAKQRPPLDTYSDRPSALPEELRQNVPSMSRGLRSTGDRFDAIPETPFSNVEKNPLSTFSIDVDTASYSKMRQYVLEQQTLPPPDSIRIEEWMNYFDYAYPNPQGDQPFAAYMRLATCPWNPEHKIARIAIQAKKVDAESRPNSNLVFLIDVSGSMGEPNKLPLVKKTLSILASQLREQDRVAIVVYAGAAGCVLPSTPGSAKDRILAAIQELQSGGSTNGGQGIQLAYKIAKENFIEGGVNRVLLCTDGDFNVGVTGTDALIAMMKENATSNVFLTCLGYGIGNYNDSMMEQVSNQGNGTYAMVDNELEARRVMIDQLGGTLMTVAKDVKIQVEFNPAKIASYRLIGYENRRLATRDFDDDHKDAGEIGAGHRVTALYEIVPVGASAPKPEEQANLRYAEPKPTKASDPSTETRPERAQEWLLLKIRSKTPESSESTRQEFILKDGAEDAFPADSIEMDWATSIAEFGLLMRRSQLAQGIDWNRMVERAQSSAGSDPYRRECLIIMQQAKRLMGQ